MYPEEIKPCAFMTPQNSNIDVFFMNKVRKQEIDDMRYVCSIIPWIKSSTTKLSHGY
jgi:hypothetical protein